MQQSISIFTMDSTKYLKKRFNLHTSNVGGPGYEVLSKSLALAKAKPPTSLRYL